MEKPLFWVFGDVHERIDLAQQFLDKEQPNKVIWLGDFFDDHGIECDPLQTVKTAIWLKELIAGRPNDIFIQSNHDLAYRFECNEKYRICGWTPARGRGVKDYFPRSNWDKFVIYHVENWKGQPIYFSHAGLHPSMFTNGMFNAKSFENLAKAGLEMGHIKEYNPLLDNQNGPMWIRWSQLPIVPGICQCVGHSTYQYPQIRMLKGGRPEWNLDMDCAHSYYAVFEETNAYAINRHTGNKHLLKLSLDI